MALPPFTAIVLAASRAGDADPLAVAAGVSHKCLVPVAGQPLIVHVVAALARVPGVERVRIVVEPAAFAAVRAVATGLGVAVEPVVAADNLADSVRAGAEGITGPLIVTTADNVLLSPDAVRAMRVALHGGAEGAVALTTRAAVLAAHPDGQRRFHRFRDDAYSNCNLYALAGAQALSAADAFRGGGQFAKKAGRIVAAFGLANLLLLRLGVLSADGAMRRISRRFGVTIRAVVLPDGAQAIDVDNPRTHAIAGELLAMRAPAPLDAAA